MFQIVADVSRRDIQRTLQGAVPLWGTIFLDWNGEAYPSSTWSDMIRLVLDEWLANFRTFDNGLVDEVTNHFIDEERFRFTVVRQPLDRLRIVCGGSSDVPELQFEITRAEYVRALLKACRRVISQYEQVAGSDTADGLRRAIAHLNA